MQWGTHGVEVVLTDEDDGKLVQLGQAQGLEEGPLVGGTVPEEAHTDPSFISMLGCPGYAGCEGHMGSDDSVATHKFVFFVENMHRPALSLGRSGAPSEQFCHHRAGGDSLGHGVSMFTISGHPIVVFGGCGGTNRDGLLADI